MDQLRQIIKIQDSQIRQRRLKKLAEENGLLDEDCWLPPTHMQDQTQRLDEKYVIEIIKQHILDEATIESSKSASMSAKTNKWNTIFTGVMTITTGVMALFTFLI